MTRTETRNGVHIDRRAEWAEKAGKHSNLDMPERVMLAIRRFNAGEAFERAKRNGNTWAMLTWGYVAEVLK